MKLSLIVLHVGIKLDEGGITSLFDNFRDKPRNNATLLRIA